MKQPRLINSARLVAALFAMTITTPTLAETASNQTAASCDAVMMSGSMEQLSPTHATVKTSTLINASVEDVWATLTDFDNMASWSTGTLQGMTGDIRDGGSVVITFIFGVDKDGKPNTNEVPHTLIYEEGRQFGWSDPFPAEIGGGNDNHIYHVEACGDKTLLVQSDEIVNNPYAANFAAQLLPMYQTFNAELKAKIEN